MATYDEIRSDVKAIHGRTMQSCWIAHVKELNGLKTRPAPNRQALNERKKPCPDYAKKWIETSMRKFGMIK